MHPAAQHTGGFDYARILDRDPVLTIDMDARTEQAMEDAWERVHPFHQTFAVGSAVGNVWEVRIPAAYIRDRSPIDRTPLRAHQYTFSLSAGQAHEDDLANQYSTLRPFAEDGEVVLINR